MRRRNRVRLSARPFPPGQGQGPAPRPCYDRLFAPGEVSTRGGGLVRLSLRTGPADRLVSPIRVREVPPRTAHAKRGGTRAVQTPLSSSGPGPRPFKPDGVGSNPTRGSPPRGEGRRGAGSAGVEEPRDTLGGRGRGDPLAPRTRRATPSRARQSPSRHGPGRRLRQMTTLDRIPGTNPEGNLCR